MGFKRQQNKLLPKRGVQGGNPPPFKLNGLIFDSEEDYKSLKRVDENIFNIVNLVKSSSANLENIFNNIKSINVTETYPDAYDEADELFVNATSLLLYEEIPGSIEYKVACKFFLKFNLIEYE